MEAANRAVRERRQEILKQSSQFQGRLIERVMAGVFAILSSSSTWRPTRTRRASARRPSWWW